MSAAKKEVKSLGDDQEMMINGGDSAGEQNGSRVAKFDPAEQPNPEYSPETALVERPQEGELNNKRPPKSRPKKRLQGKSQCSQATAALALPPAEPIQLARGRKPVLTPDRIEQLLQIVSIGLSPCAASAHLGIDRSTVSRTASKDPEFKAALERAEELSKLQPQLTIIAEARKNWRAALAWLEYMAKHRPARKKTAEEKEEEHQENLDWVRRVNEEMDAARGKKQP
jgi:hypothetical protein